MTVHSKRVMTLVRINTYTSNILETREELERDKQSFERDEEEMTQPVDPPSNDVTIVVSNQRTMIEKITEKMVDVMWH